MAEQQESRDALRAQARALLERLTQTYPAAFFPLGERRVQPLKLGIHKELAPVAREWGYEGGVLRYALGGYTRQLRYQMALLKAPHRVDLQGEPAGEITAEHRQAAQEKVDQIREKRKKDKKDRKPPPKPRQHITEETIVALQKKLSTKATH